MITEVEWFPVSDPPYYEDVLVLIADSNDVGIGWLGQDGKWYAVGGYETRVQYWAHIPDPPGAYDEMQTNARHDQRGDVSAEPGERRAVVEDPL